MTSFDDRVPRSLRGEIAIRTIVDRAHESAMADSIQGPDADGRFPEANLPLVLPVVIDANALRDEIIRVDKPRSILANAANSGVLRLYCAGHVVDEVWEHYGEWAIGKGVDTAEVLQLWQSTYLPLLRRVDVPEGLTDASESARLVVLGTADDPDGDPDDVPSATLALVLGVPFLSKDRRSLLAVYGPGFDHIGHADWLKKISAGGDLAPGGTMANVSINLVAGASIGAYHGTTALVTKFGGPAVLLGALGAAAIFQVATEPETKRRALSTVGRAAEMTLESLAAILALKQKAQARFDELARPVPEWQLLSGELGSDRALQRACLYAMARSPRGVLNAVEVADLLRELPLPARGQTRVRSALHSLAGHGHPDPHRSALHEPVFGRFQLGVPLQVGPPCSDVR